VNHEPGAIRAFLSIVIDRELGSIQRFPTPKHLSSYSGLVPRHPVGKKPPFRPSRARPLPNMGP